jgi:hypothetical protein
MTAQNSSILPYPILFYPNLIYLPYRILSYSVLPCSTSSHPDLFYPILSYLVPSCSVLSYPILSLPILIYPFISYLSYPNPSCTALSYRIQRISGLKRTDYEANHALPSSAVVKNACSLKSWYYWLSEFVGFSVNGSCQAKPLLRVPCCEILRYPRW